MLGINLDLVLVPTGILFMVGYHIYLVYRIIKHPNSTVIGFENGNRRVWVQQMMENMPSNTGLALQVVASNISAAVYLVSLSITLSSLIGTLVGASTSSGSTATNKGLVNVIIFGDKSAVTASIKYVSLLICFLIAFMSHVQCIRYYIHVSFLISTPRSSVPADYIENSVIRGSNFWSLGLRAYYFAFPLLLWIFGPIPMFVCVLGLISTLYFLDSTVNPIPPFAVKSSSKGMADIGRGIESNAGRNQCSLGGLLEFQ
uniref:Uncharacterized protein n=1 Tax=Picea sitchensis TaxID=3332 RepID=A9NL95_PICSI|nr:unknown [Picea sitchensis]